MLLYMSCLKYTYVIVLKFHIIYIYDDMQESFIIQMQIKNNIRSINWCYNLTVFAQTSLQIL